MFIFILVLIYVLGTINPALIIVKRVSGIDIREVNSKNAGTSNVAMTIGLKYAVAVGIIDILKGFIPVFLLTQFYPDNEILWFAGGLGAIVGHVYPFNMGFRGGKGTATFGGVVLAVAPMYSIPLLVLFFLLTIVTDFIALATLVIVIIIPIGMYFLDYNYISIFIVILFTILSIYKHYPNLIRIINKTETGLKEGLKK